MICLEGRNVSRETLEAEAGGFQRRWRVGPVHHPAAETIRGVADGPGEILQG